MLTHRRERASEFILEELTTLTQGAVQDPRVQALTLTGVQLTPDRRIARVYVACYAGEDALQEGLKGLESAKGFLRRELATLLHWRFTPELDFRVDRSWEQGAKIDSLLKTLDQQPGGQDDAESE
jgi:ribosome-binding factor A